jgi:hypothetical protein
MSDKDTFLQRYFDASLIPTDTTDERLGHYQAAAGDLAKRFSEAPAEAVSASRVAIDPKCPASDPWFAAVEEAVKAHWKTFLAKHHDAPRQICRGILLEALREAVEKDDLLSAAIWNSASNLLAHMGTGPEQAITREFISRLGDRCEAYSSSIWRIGDNSPGKQPQFDFPVTPIEAAKVDQTTLEQGMSDAAGPHNSQSQAFGNPNPHWSNAAPHWSYHFAPRAAKSIATEVDKALTAISPAINGLTKQLGPALNAHANALAALVTASIQQIQGFTTLLWWKQALYSPTLRRSYRDMDPGPLAVAMPFDLAEVSGAPVPQSVEYFLRETMLAVVPADPRLTLAQLAAATKSSDKVEPFLPKATSDTPCRVSLREFLRLHRERTLPAKSIPAYVGVSSTIELRLSEWAVWLLRERLAEILSDTKA